MANEVSDINIINGKTVVSYAPVAPESYSGFKPLWYDYDKLRRYLYNHYPAMLNKWKKLITLGGVRSGGKEEILEQMHMFIYVLYQVSLMPPTDEERCQIIGGFQKLLNYTPKEEENE